MSADPTSTVTTDPCAIDGAIAQVKDKAREFARLPPVTKAQLLRECMAGLLSEAPAWVAAGAKARGADPTEEWLAGPLVTVRLFRLFAESLDRIAARGRPTLGRTTRIRKDGRLEVALIPSSTLDRISFSGFTGFTLMETGVSLEDARARQAAFYQQQHPEGGLSAILGAGNVSSIPAMDVATKMFIEGKVCVLKMNPVNDWVGPFLERALAPLISRHYLRIVYGGWEEGEHLVHHALVDDAHLTGSAQTHDQIVWGAPGTERERSRANRRPLLEIPITSELGNVSPVAIVPHQYGDRELRFMARNVATMVVNNASFNCNAAKMIVTTSGWPQRSEFLDMIGSILANTPTRCAYYPGASERWHSLLSNHADAERYGDSCDGNLQWALVRDLDAGDREEPLFSVEPFCGILSETSVGSADPAEFLAAATEFMNQRLWGTLNAAIMIPPGLEADPDTARALDRAIVDLRYGTVAINHWPALSYGFGCMPWGGHQSSTLSDIQSGLGWVHNTFMLSGVDKSVIRGPLTVRPYPVWFFDNEKTSNVAPRLVEMEASPSWFKLPGILRRVMML